MGHHIGFASLRELRTQEQKDLHHGKVTVAFLLLLTIQLSVGDACSVSSTLCIHNHQAPIMPNIWADHTASALGKNSTEKYKREYKRRGIYMVPIGRALWLKCPGHCTTSLLLPCQPCSQPLHTLVLISVSLAPSAPLAGNFPFTVAWDEWMSQSSKPIRD